MSHSNESNSRLEEIHQWLKTVLPSVEYTMEAASSDASFRRYFRVTIETKTWILMDAPPEQEDTQPFIDIARFLLQNGVNVPEIYASNIKSGFLLLSDFGNSPYLNELNENSVNELYKAAIDSLIKIQLSPTDEIRLPNYDKVLLEQEMNLFPEWYLQRHLNIAIPNFLETTFDTLTASALEQPQRIVHRDYHSRNLMHTIDNSPGIIDFQDAVIGPISYDLVSLLRDCYILWPDEKVSELIEYYFSIAQNHGLLTDVSLEQFIKWFDLMGLQRHIKVLGIFCRLNYRDGKSNYMNDLALTLHYVRNISSKYPEFSELSNFLNQPEISPIS